ncbi:MAG: class I SAM-dependent methyltransferase [Candidatus Hermodarchaeota archaeon]
MLNRLRAWKELLRLGITIPLLLRKAHVYFRGNIIKVLDKEGWFDYLDTPRTLEEFETYFQYKDRIFLKEILEVLIRDETLKLIEESQYKTIRPLDDSWLDLEVFPMAFKEILANYAQELPKRLRGEEIAFGGGTNLYNWDEALATRLYEQVRRAAFAFSDALTLRGKFLDVGCGNGYGTTNVWWQYYKKNRFYEDSPMEIFGMDIEEDLLRIAEEEFQLRLENYFGNFKDREVTFQSLKSYFPSFIKGSVTEIPFEDETFDIVYAANLLHWTDAKTAIRELMRVAKPNALIFGSGPFVDNVDEYLYLHVNVVKGITGFFSKKDFITWAKEAGAKKIKTATPISVFRMRK